MLTSTEAQLFVADLATACEFYTRKLGFTVAFTYGDPPAYGQVVRGGARLNLRVVREPVFAGDVREREHLLAATLTLASAEEIELLCARYVAAAVRFVQTLETQSWGATTFIVADPDGNQLLFAAPARR